MTTSVAIIEAGRVLKDDSAGAVVPWWSFTKTVIAAAALALVRQNVLRLDEELPGRPFTLRQLLQHRAGLTDYGESSEYREAVARNDDAWPAEIMLQKADAGRLKFEPARGWAYSNIGYCLLRQWMEKSCDAPLDQLLQQLVFAPLDIAGPRLALKRADLDGVAALGGYDPQWVYHGLLVGTLGDAARLLDRLMTSGFLAPYLRAEMCGGWPVRDNVEGRPWHTAAYGFGVMTGTAGDGARRIGHSGSGPGSVIAVYHHPDVRSPFTVAAFAADAELGAVERAAFAA